MAHATTVKLGWSHPATEEEYTIRCRVTQGCEGRGPDMNGPGEPPEPGEVEVLKVVDAQGVSHPELISLAQDTVDEVDAFDKAESNRSGAEEDYWEAQREERRSQLDRVMASIVGGR